MSVRLSYLPAWLTEPLIVAGILLAWRNVGRRRCDIPGGVRLAILTASVRLGEILLHAHHPPDWDLEYELFVFAAGRALWAGSLMFVFYLAIDPFVRRYWPGMLISWTRALRGRLADPMLGRDVLIGTTMGAAIQVITYAEVAARTWADPAAPPVAFDRVGFAFDALLGVRYVLGQFGWLANYALTFGLGMLLILVLVRSLVRRVELAVAITYAMIMIMEFRRLGPVPWTIMLMASLVFVLFLWGFVRYGLVAAVASVWSRACLASLPITTDFDAWYAPRALIVLGTVAALGLLGARAALAGRSPFDWWPDLDDPGDPDV